jgi:uncharacterized protein involved in propanediol utilization
MADILPKDLLEAVADVVVEQGELGVQVAQ